MKTNTSNYSFIMKKFWEDHRLYLMLPYIWGTYDSLTQNTSFRGDRRSWITGTQKHFPRRRRRAEIERFGPSVKLSGRPKSCSTSVMNRGLSCPSWITGRSFGFPGDKHSLQWLCGTWRSKDATWNWVILSGQACVYMMLHTNQIFEKNLKW